MSQFKVFKRVLGLVLLVLLFPVVSFAANEHQFMNIQDCPKRSPNGGHFTGLEMNFVNGMPGQRGTDVTCYYDGATKDVVKISGNYVAVFPKQLPTAWEIDLYHGKMACNSTDPTQCSFALRVTQ